MSVNDRPVDTIVQEDISTLLKSWRNRAKSEATQFLKPSIFFLGDSGVGKSSIIKTIFGGDMPKDQLEKMNISHNGKEGTTDFVEVKGNNCICIDARGKRRNEDEDSYRKCMGDYLGNRVQPDYLFFIIPALDSRDQDIIELAITAKIYNELFQKHFVVLMNKYDEVTNPEKILRFQERKELAEKTFCSIGHNKYFGSKSFCKGVFEVAAAPPLQLPSTCPNQPSNVRPTQVHQMSIYTNRYSFCSNCKIAFIGERIILTKEEEEDFTNLNFKKEMIGLKPVGLTLHGDVLRTVLLSVEDIVVVPIIKALAQSIQECCRGAKIIIQRSINACKSSDLASEIDKKMCIEIAQSFGFTCTGVPHGYFEASCWTKVQQSLFQQLKELLFGSGMEILLACWGIYYTLKYSAVAILLLQSFSEQCNYSTFEIGLDLVEKCQHLISTEYDRTKRIQKITSEVLKNGWGNYFESLFILL